MIVESLFLLKALYSLLIVPIFTKLKTIKATDITREIFDAILFLNLNKIKLPTVKASKTNKFNNI